MAVESGEYEYDAAVSFAGEDRAIALQFAAILKSERLSVFYDQWEQADLWGRDLYQHLDEVYSKKARFCVMFLSAHYAVKAWTNQELKSAQTRAFQENDEYILPLRLDDTAIPGIRPTLGYLDLRRISVEDAAQVAIQKIAAARSRSGVHKAPSARGTQLPSPSARSGKLQLKRRFTDHDRDTFLEEAYEGIAKFFEDSLADLQIHHENIVGKYRRVSANHFTATVFRNGESVSTCGIRLGGFFSGNQITYSDDPFATNSMNEAVSIADDGQIMFLKAIGFSTVTSGRSKEAERLSPEGAAEMFWALLVAPLQR